MPFLKAALPLLLAGFAMCASSQGVTDGSGVRPALSTDRAEYAVDTRGAISLVRIVATYTNTTRRTRYIGRCGDEMPRFVLDDFDGSSWSVSYRPICALVQVPPIEVPPGGRRTDTITVVDQPNLRTDNTLSLERRGRTYRLVYAIFGDYEPRSMRELDLLPVEERASSGFIINP
jgi:hypothetical protein